MVIQPTFGGGERRRIVFEESMEGGERRRPLAEESQGAEEIHDYLDEMEKGGTSSEFKPMRGRNPAWADSKGGTSSEFKPMRGRNPAWADSKEGAQEMHDDFDQTETEGTTSVRKTRKRLKSVLMAGMMPRLLRKRTSSSPSQDDSIDSPVVHPWLCKMASHIFENNFRRMDMNFHRFPAGMKNLGERYIVPMVVSIGPYHRKLGQFEATEEVKLVTACQFVSSSSGSFEEICAAIRPLVSLSRSLYEPLPRSLFEHVLPGYTDDDLVRMMLLDGCFLLQYMLMYTARDKLSSSLLCYFDSNQASISNDIMLLENQIPWAVIETLRRFKEVPVEEFVAKMGRTFQVRKEKEREEFDLGDGYKPPHLLGLLRFYKTRHTLQVPKKNEQKLPALGSSSASQVPTSDQDRQISMSKSISAIELAEIGIKLMASKTTKLVDMGMEKTPLSGNIFLAPLLLDDIRSCWLVNMAALEVCLATGVRDDEEPVVCSYLALLAMLMDREEDVHKLRSKRLVQGELTNKETLDFFKTLIKHISGGSLYIRILEEIEDYKLKRRIWIKIYEYVYQNKKAIVTVLSLIGVLAGIFKALLSVKHGQQ